MKRKMIGTMAAFLLIAGLAGCGKQDNGSVSVIDVPVIGASSSQAAGSSEADASTSGVLPETGAADSAQGAAGSAGQTPPAGTEQNVPAQTPSTTTPQTSPPQQTQNTGKQPSSTGGGHVEAPSAPPQQPQAPQQTPPASQSKQPAISEVATAVEQAMGLQTEMMQFTSEDLSALYGLSSAAVEGFVGKMPMMNVQATEYLVVKAAPGQVDTVKAGMQKRQADLDTTWKQYLPEQYALVQNYKLVANGEYVLFAVGENAQAAVNAFNNLTK